MSNLISFVVGLNWTAVSVCLAAIALVVNSSQNSKKFKADLISKSRIDWMKTVRDLYAEFIQNCSLYTFLCSSYFAGDSKVDNSDLTNIMAEIKKSYYKLKLYIPNNDSNELLTKNINLMYKTLDKTINYYNQKKIKGYSSDSEYIKKLEVMIAKGVDDGNRYFKNEWEKAKKGK